MKRYIIVVILLLVSSGMVRSQPFTASITLFPGCGMQYAYGQKVCGEFTVSDDAWVTRWVEDEYGSTWYHWGTRYYTGGSHTFCGYMGLPIGKHIMKIHAQRVSDGAEVDAQCEYIVCCASSVWIPGKPECSCENVKFTADIDRAQVGPGEYITVTVTIINNMVSDCKKKFEAGHLEVDWGILGGDTSPLEKDVLVRSGETKVILEETHLIPPVSEGEYTVVIYYSDSECTWIDYASVEVVVPTGGSLEILSYPDMVNVDERARIKVLVRNQSKKDAEFMLTAAASEGVYLPRNLYPVTVSQAGYQEVNIEFQPEQTGIHTIQLELTSEGKNLGSASLTVTAEKPLSGDIAILSSVPTVEVGETASVTLRVKNTCQYGTTYQFTVMGPTVRVSPVPELFVPKNQERQVEMYITPETEGIHEVIIQLEAENQLMDSETVSFEAETKGVSQILIAGIIGGLAVVVVVIFIVWRR
ncbi:MAG: hypothetical protein PVF58_13320 [Candidatus Methanofastidiosia archaeon]